MASRRDVVRRIGAGMSRAEVLRRSVAESRLAQKRSSFECCGMALDEPQAEALVILWNEQQRRNEEERADGEASAG